MTDIDLMCQCLLNLVNYTCFFGWSILSVWAHWVGIQYPFDLGCIPGPLCFLKSCSFHVNLPLTLLHLWLSAARMCAALHFSPARVPLCCDWQINYGVHACVPCRRLSRGGGNLPSCKAMRLVLGGHSTPDNVYLPDLVTGTGLLRHLGSPSLCTLP